MQQLCGRREKFGQPGTAYSVTLLPVSGTHDNYFCCAEPYRGQAINSRQLYVPEELGLGGLGVPHRPGALAVPRGLQLFATRQKMAQKEYRDSNIFHGC